MKLLCRIGLHNWPTWANVSDLPDKHTSGMVYRDFRLQVVQRRECPDCKQVELRSQTA